MADFTPSKKTLQDFNNGVKYVDYDLTTGTNGDEVQADTINNLVESQMWVQKLGENPVNNTSIAVEGIPEIGIEVDNITGLPNFYARSLVGKSQIMYNKTLTLGSAITPLTSLPSSTAFLQSDFYPSTANSGLIVGKTFFVDEEIYLPAGGAGRGGIKHTYLTLYKIVTVTDSGLTGIVVSRVETTGNGIKSITAVGTESTNEETKTIIEVTFTNSTPQTFEIVAKNGNLFEIPYNLFDAQNDMAIVDFIINNIDKIKKGAYFKTDDNQYIVLEQVRRDTDVIEILFNYGSSYSSDSVEKYCIAIDIPTTTVDMWINRQNTADYTDLPQLLVGQWLGNMIQTTVAAVTASPENEGKGVGIQNSNFVAMDFATKADVGNAIATAITTALNTPV